MYEMYKINKTISDLKNGQYSLEQIGILEYAIYKYGLESVTPIMKPSISNDYMNMFVKFMEQGIDVTPYVSNVWKTPVQELEQQIKVENPPKIKIKKGMK